MHSLQHIFLIGFSGSGKTTTGKLLAKRFRCRFVDIDSMIEKKAHKKIVRIFAEDGEKEFRKLEVRTIKEVIRKSKTAVVVALGGGAFADRAIRKMISSSGISIWLKCSLKEIYRRMKNHSDRPLLYSSNKVADNSTKALKARIRKLHEKRKKDYASADIHIVTSNKTPGQVARELHRRISESHATG